MANKLQITDVYVDGEVLRGTKMNTLVSGINNALAMAASALGDIAGDDRVIDNADSATELLVTASGPADMNVNIAVGNAIVSSMLCRNESPAVLTIVTPTVSNRYDLVQISNEGVLSTKSSAEQGSPVEPSADADNIKLAAIYLPQNTTKIEDASGGFGYLIDRRTPMSLHPTTVTRHLPMYIPGQVGVALGPNNDGYYLGKVASGITFGIAVTINKVAIQAYDAPTGAAMILTFRNITDATNDTATLSDGEYFEEDATIDLDLDAADELALEITQVGSTNPGGDLSIIIQYSLQ